MDLAFTQNPETGKLTFARNSNNDFYFDTLAIYPVIATLYAEKGRYMFDRSLGTFLSQIKQDGRATGSRLTAVQVDAIDQCRQEGLLLSGSGSSNRLRIGTWELLPTWKPIAGNSPRISLRI